MSGKLIAGAVCSIALAVSVGIAWRATTVRPAGWTPMLREFREAEENRRREIPLLVAVAADGTRLWKVRDRASGARWIYFSSSPGRAPRAGSAFHGG